MHLGLVSLLSNAYVSVTKYCLARHAVGALVEADQEFEVALVDCNLFTLK